VRDKYGDDFIREIDVLSAKDFDKVGSAASSWAKRRAKGMQLYGHGVRHDMTLQLEWLEPASPNGARTQRLVAQQVVELDERTGKVLSRRAVKQPARHATRKRRK
jgi:hypothetical protein